MIYNCFAKSFVKTKVEREANHDMVPVWRRLKILTITREVHEVSYLMIHNKLPIQERLYRIQLSRDPYCLLCPNAEIQDVLHAFIKCDKVVPYWNWTRNLCFNMLGHTNVEEESLLKYQWPRSNRDRDICWLIGHYNFILWEMLFKRKVSEISEKEFFGFMKFKYKEALASSTVSGIVGLL